MQDFQPISDQNSARIFSSETLSGWDNRRIRAYPSATMAAIPHHPPPPLKCPRCDSQNTKFCYYNNYNLSQPRHFCKSCRRYWTKGGVLRNVPIGGGCRKPKRSSIAKSRRSSVSRSVLPDSAISIFPNSSSSDPNPPNPRNFDQNFTPAGFEDSSGIFSSLLAGSGNRSGLNFVDTPFLCVPDRFHEKPEEIPVQMADNRGENSAIDWPPAMDSGVCEIAGADFPASYWNDAHWTDGDPSLYLP